MNANPAVRPTEAVEPASFAPPPDSEPLACASPAEVKTVAFLDCCGYSEYTEAHGDVAGVEAHLRMRRAVETSAATTDVVIVKWTGDGAMLAADGSTDALTCIYHAMLVMRESGPLALRAGVTVGPVRQVPRGDLDYLGSAVNNAARLCAQAAPWQVRVGRQLDHAGIHFTLRLT